jgi:hypothetical protein
VDEVAIDVTADTGTSTSPPNTNCVVPEEEFTAVTTPTDDTVAVTALFCASVDATLNV